MHANLRYCLITLLMVIPVSSWILSKYFHTQNNEVMINEYKSSIDKLGGSQRKFGAMPEGYWFSFSSGGCFSDSVIYQWSGNILYQIKNGKKYIFMKDVKIEFDEIFMKISGIVNVNYKSFSKHPVVFTYIDGRDTLANIEIETNKQKLPKKSGQEFFPETSMIRCGSPLKVKGDFAGRKPFDPALVRSL